MDCVLPRRSTAARALTRPALALTLGLTLGLAGLGSARADIITVTANDLSFTFSPSTVTVHPGDTVRFVLGSVGFHSVRQTAAAGSCTALAGGFNSGFCGGTTQFDLPIPANASGSIFYMCECHCVRGMRGQINVVPACNTPVVTQDPAAVNGCVGASVTFTVAADGTGPLSYQWRRAQADLAGATSSTLVLDHVSVNDAGSYDCVVTNACGHDTSAAALLSVCGPDFNCDGFLDFFDYDDFVSAFEGGDPRADYNGDDFADFFDYDAYITDFELGC